MSIMGDTFTHGTLREIGAIIDQLRAEGCAADYIVVYIRGYCEHWQQYDQMDPNAPKYTGPTVEEKTALIAKRRRS